MKKKFANLEYPGISADPNEGSENLSTSITWRFQEQIQVIGAKAQEALFQSSVLVLPTNALAVPFVKKLFFAGFGRVGLLLNEPATGSYEKPSSEPIETAFDMLTAWSKREAPWATLESFSTSTLESGLEDVVRGFQFVVCTDLTTTEKLLAHRTDLVNGFHYAFAIGTKAVCGFFDSASSDQSCQETLQKIRLQLAPQTPKAGILFPVVDLLASTLTLRLTKGATDESASNAGFEGIELSF